MIKNSSSACVLALLNHLRKEVSIGISHGSEGISNMHAIDFIKHLLATFPQDTEISLTHEYKIFCIKENTYHYLQLENLKIS